MKAKRGDIIKRTGIMLIIFSMMLATACGTKPKADNIIDVGATPAATQTTLIPVTPLPRMDGIGEQAEETPEYGSNARVEITGSVAHVFSDEKGATLYGAVEYKNTGDCPVIITNARFDFNINGQTQTYEFQPALSEYDVVMPGGHSYVCTWYPVESNFEPGESISLDAALDAQKSSDTRADVLVENLYIADNYPGFSTLSGSLRGVVDTPRRLNVVNVGFYDASGKLLAVWYFTKDAHIAKDDFKTFVVHIKGLPIGDFSKKAAALKAVAFAY